MENKNLTNLKSKNNNYVGGSMETMEKLKAVEKLEYRLFEVISNLDPSIQTEIIYLVDEIIAILKPET